jgi:PAS domain S-box-containing protein
MKPKPSRSKSRAAPPRRRARKRPSAAGDGRFVPYSEMVALQENLRVAQETLDAIRSGEVDAVVVNGTNGAQVYSLAGADQPYRVYVERMQEGAATIGRDGLILYCNRRFAEMLGRPLERVISSSLPHHLNPEAWHKLGDVFAHGTEVVKYETTLAPADPAAPARPVNLTASRLPLEGPPMMCLVVTDLTAQKEQEAQRLARDLAEKANAAKDDFLAALSHELRTPLTPALMAATVLEKDTSLPESVRSDIALIRRNIELEARLIDDLLDLTLITHGKLSLQTSAINVHTCLHRAIEVIQADARQKRVTLQIELGAQQTEVIGDPVRVQQVCWNVLRNAVKFTPARGLISLTTGNDEHGRIWIRVTDTGIGFPMERAQSIFEAFEQGGRHVTRQFGGLGLGLAITRSIMHAHGGGVEGVSAGHNRGATFTLRFPLAPATSRKSARPAPPPEPERRGLAILLVEDHKDTRACVQRVLQANGHRITAAADAQAALTAAAAAPFDLIISDLGLPDLTGHELMRRLRAHTNAPAIALSGYGMENDLEQSRAAGFKHHLTKPVSFDQLKSYVAEIAAQREAGVAAESSKS